MVYSWLLLFCALTGKTTLSGSTEDVRLLVENQDSGKSAILADASMPTLTLEPVRHHPFSHAHQEVELMDRLLENHEPEEDAIIPLERDDKENQEEETASTDDSSSFGYDFISPYGAVTAYDSDSSSLDLDPHLIPIVKPTRSRALTSSGANKQEIYDCVCFCCASIFVISLFVLFLFLLRS